MTEQAGFPLPSQIADVPGRGELALHVPVLHALPAGGRQALLVLQLDALPRADAGLRHDHRGGAVPGDRRQHGAAVRVPDHARHRAPDRERPGLHHRQPGARPGGDRAARGGVRAARRVLLRELGLPVRGVEGPAAGADRRDRVDRGAAAARVGARRRGVRRGRRRAEPLPAGELPPGARAVLQDVAPPHRDADARLRRLRGVLPVLPAGVPRDQRPDHRPHGGRHRRDHVPAGRRAQGRSPGSPSNSAWTTCSPRAASPPRCSPRSRPAARPGRSGSTRSARHATRGSTSPPATASTTITCPGTTT